MIWNELSLRLTQMHSRILFRQQGYMDFLDENKGGKA
jgi:hypothetical protein